MDVIIPNLVRVLFDPAIPTSSFNLFNYFLYLYNIILHGVAVTGNNIIMTCVCMAAQ